MKSYKFQLDYVDIVAENLEDAKRQALDYLKSVTEILNEEITEQGEIK